MLDANDLNLKEWQAVAERFQRGLQRAFTMHPKPSRKPKERPASKGRVYKGKTRT
jgi:hypothetical protein